MLLELNRITVPPGQRVLLSNVSWQEFEAILEDLGEHRASRVAYDNGTLQINVLRDGKYIKCEYSPNFPNLQLIEIIPQYLNQCRTLGRNKTMKAFRAWVREQLARG